MKHYTRAVLIAALVTTFTASHPSFAQDKSWFIRPNIGLSSMSNQMSMDSSAVVSMNDVDVEIDSGFVAGLGVGYRLNNKWSTELAWEYRTNDSQVNFSGERFEDGDYASNIFHLNATYSFSGGLEANRWKPYLGAGFSWVQEVDIDLESAGQEFSFSSNGDIGLQAFAGIEYSFDSDWQIQAELRYGSVTGIELEPEQPSVNVFPELNYQPVTLQLGLVYNF